MQTHEQKGAYRGLKGASLPCPSSLPCPESHLKSLENDWVAGGKGSPSSAIGRISFLSLTLVTFVLTTALLMTASEANASEANEPLKHLLWKLSVESLAQELCGQKNVPGFAGFKMPPLLPEALLGAKLVPTEFARESIILEHSRGIVVIGCGGSRATISTLKSANDTKSA